MAWITLEKARENLEMWLRAEEKVSAGQSYTIGSRNVTRASLSQIANRIAYWRGVVENLEAAQNKNGGGRFMRGVPRDL